MEPRGFSSFSRTLGILSLRIRIVMVGLPSSGKTTILRNLRFHHFTHKRKGNLHVEKARESYLTIHSWDVGGEDHQLWIDYLRNFKRRLKAAMIKQRPKVIIFVVDSTDPDQLPLARVELQRILTELPDVYLLIYANKQDLANAMPADVITVGLGLNDIVRADRWGIYCTNAQSMAGIFSGLSWLAGKISVKGPTKKAITRLAQVPRILRPNLLEEGDLLPLPNELILSLRRGGDAPMVEQKWHQMVHTLREKGCFRDTLVVFDRQGSRAELTSIALLLTQLSQGYWREKILEFSRDPRIRTVQGNTLAEKLEWLESMHCDEWSSVKALFRRVRRAATQNNLGRGSMIRRIIVLTTKGFDDAFRYKRPFPELQSRRRNPFVTKASSKAQWSFTDDYCSVTKKFKDYEYVAPELVFWDLSDPKNPSGRCVPGPVESPHSRATGLKIIKGFSKDLLASFLEKDGVVDEFGRN